VYHKRTSGGHILCIVVRHDCVAQVKGVSATKRTSAHGGALNHRPPLRFGHVDVLVLKRCPFQYAVTIRANAEEASRIDKLSCDAAKEGPAVALPVRLRLPLRTFAI
jgi:hypothetical protein